MCGIVGIWDFKNKIEPELLKSMRDTLKHRGPDDSGLFIDEKANIGLGHRRLSILDLSERGHQPMRNEDGNLWITYNGEVYNFQAIKKELEQKRYNFSSSSDTEVVLKSFEEWGIEGVKKFRGMFAYALWDKRNQRLTLVRDRTGIKPLYYYFDGSLFIFASELKAILKHKLVKKELNLEALYLFLELSYIPAPHSIFKDIKKIEPGHCLVLDGQKRITKTKYWDVFDFYLKQKGKNKIGEQFGKNEEEITQELEAILQESFKLRMVSDVEVGHFLSGGIDSSTVAALLTKKLGLSNLKTFTIGFQEAKYNEAPFAKRVAEYLGTEHHELYCTQKQAMEIVPSIADIYDEPFGDSSSVPTYLVSRFTRNLVKVSLSADGGDETFCGYDRYWLIDALFQKFQRTPKFLLKGGLNVFKILSPEVLSFLYKNLGFFLPEQLITKKKIHKLKRKIAKLKEIVKNPKDLISFYKLLGFGFWKTPELSDLLLNFPLPSNILVWGLEQASRIGHLDNLTKMQAIDYKTYLADDILVKVDRASMAVGLEGRDPLLDHKIIEYVASLPVGLKYKQGTSKYILRKILYKYIPKELLERPKQGFSIPLEDWLRGDLRFLIDRYLDKERIKKQGIFNWQVIEEEKKKFLEKGIDYADHLWLLITFEMWHEKW